MEELYKEIIDESTIGCIWGNFNNDKFYVCGINNPIKELLGNCKYENVEISELLQIDNDNLYNILNNHEEEIEICELIPRFGAYYYIVINRLLDNYFALWFTYKNEFNKWSKDVLKYSKIDIYMKDSLGRCIFLNGEKGEKYQKFNTSSLLKNDESYTECLKVVDNKLFANTSYRSSIPNFEVGSLIDISEENKLDDNTAILGFRYKLLEKLLDYVPDMILCSDNSGNIIYMNSTLTYLIGNNRNKLSGAKARTVYSALFEDESRAEHLLKLDSSVIKSKNSIITARYIDDSPYMFIDGNYYLIEKVPFFNCSNYSEGVLTTFRNISDYIYERKELERLSIDFLKKFSDKIRFPLGNYFAALQMVQALDKDFSEKYDRYLSIARKNGMRLLKLINNIVDLSLIEKKELVVTYNTEDIVEYIKLLIDTSKAYFDMKKIELSFTTNIDECVFSFDKFKVSRILLNLLSNSIKFNTEGGHVKVEIYYRKSAIDISVTDDGIGIDKDDFENIFRKFKQIGNRFTKICEGPSIGLSLAMEYAKIHGGNIKVDSEKGRFTKFTLVLPVKIIKDTYDSDMINHYGDINSEVEIAFSDLYM